MILEHCLSAGASDIHITPEQPVRWRIGGQLQLIESEGAGQPITLSSDEVQQLVEMLLNSTARETLEKRGSCDGAMTYNHETRFRFNVYRRDSKLAVALRKLEERFYSLPELGLSDDLYRICDLKYGLVLVAGPTGSGKSTTLATLVNRVNESRPAHIITIEDPVEYVHPSKMALVNQRQVGIDSPSFHQALVDSLRQDPDVILIGEIRDLDTIRTAITAAETGHLVLASIHAGDCVGAVERLISVFPADEQSMIQRLLGMVLRCVIAQHLIVAETPLATRQPAGSLEPPGGTNPIQPANPLHRGTSQRALAAEIMWGTTAVGNLIASGQTRQIGSMIESGTADGMQTLDASLIQLLRRKRISEAVARSLAKNPNLVVQRARSR